MNERSFSSDQSNIEPIFRLVEVFEAHKELRFPGVSAETLTSAMAGIDQQIDELARLEEALVEARAALSARREGLIGLARQAHAYATIFTQAPAAGTGTGETDAKLDELRQRLAAINLNDGEGSVEKPGRKRRMKPASSMLPEVSEQELEDSLSPTQASSAETSSVETGSVETMDPFVTSSAKTPGRNQTSPKAAE